MRGSKILLATLQERGIKTIYGIVGREAEVIRFNEVNGIDFILTRDERSAAFMADIQGRLTGKVGVCYSTFGPGASNLATGVASAYMDRSPMLAISAQVEKDTIHPSTHQCLDQVSLMRPITKYSKEVLDIGDLQEEIVQAIMIAEEGIPGPSFLSIPLDIFEDEGDFKQTATIIKASGFNNYEGDKRSPLLNSEEKQISGLLELINKSNFPIFIIGNGGCRGTESTILSNLLNSLRIPAVTTYAGKGCISCTHPCYLGTVSKYLDYITPGVLKEIFIEADLIVLVGFDMVEGVTPQLWKFGRKKKVCAINSILENKRFFIPVDLEINLPYIEIFEHIMRNINKRFFSLKMLKDLKEKISVLKENIFRNNPGLNPFTIVNILNRVLSEDDILISDVGIHKQFVSLFYEVEKPKTFFCSNGLGSMGFGLPAAIGAKKTFPHRRVIIVSGDGGFHSSSHDLETSIRYNLPVICIVFCDDSVGLIRHYQRKGFKESNENITNFGRVDFVKLTEANGGKGYRVTSEIELYNSLLNALNTDITVLIEVPLERKKYLW